MLIKVAEQNGGDFVDKIWTLMKNASLLNCQLLAQTVDAWADSSELKNEGLISKVIEYFISALQFKRTLFKL